MNNNKKIHYNSEQAAQKKTVTGWFSSEGHFYGDNEHLARFGGCTHRDCEKCGEECSRSYTQCEKCRGENNNQRYLNKPFKEWDEDTPLVLYDDDTYFFSRGEVEDFCEDGEINIEELQLIICEPSKLPYVEEDEIFEDILPEGSTVSECAPEISAAFENLNNVIENSSRTFSWFGGKFRTTVKEDK